MVEAIQEQKKGRGEKGDPLWFTRSSTGTHNVMPLTGYIFQVLISYSVVVAGVYIPTVSFSSFILRVTHTTTREHKSQTGEK